MEKINYLFFAIPAFFLFLCIEFRYAAKRKRKDLFRYESSVSNVSIGIAERLIDIFIAGSFIPLYFWIYEHYRLFDIPKHWSLWIVVLLVTDFIWYWYHRLGHKVNFFWAAHIVHHQSEEFNFTVAARITTFQAVIRDSFWCLLPFIGFDPHMVSIMLILHGAYSFFTHTRMGKNLGWLEHVLITPSLHGVHHASNEKYLDKNFGDVFVFWDKLFGTFQKEEEQPRYGLTHPLHSYSFLWQHFHYYLEIIEACRRTSSLREKLKIIFGSPTKIDPQIRPYLEKKFLQNRQKKGNLSPFRRYITFQLLLSVAVLIGYTVFFERLGALEKLAAISFVLLTLINCGALMEQKRWIYYLEYGRLFLVSAFVLHRYEATWMLIPVLLAALFLEMLFDLHRKYLRYVYKYSDE